MPTYSANFEALATFSVLVEADTPEEAGDAVENWGEDVAWGQIKCTDLTGDCVLMGEPERY